MATDGEDGLAVDDFSLTAVAPLPNISVNDVTQAEGQGGTTNFTFTAGISAPAPAGGVTFDIATADGTAQDGNPLNEDQDYSSVSFAGMTIPQGQSSYQFTVAVNGDREVELNETFFVNLTNITGAVATDPQGVGTIQNDDDSPLALVVTKTDDTADGACDLDCSLREAIAAANSASGDDTITFAPSANGTTVLTADLPAISSNGTLTITGNGITNTIVSGPHSVFNVQTSALLAVSRIAISTAGGTGGPIVNEGTLTMDQCSIAGSTGGDGAVSNRPGGTLNILGCMISGNSVGGAIHTAGTTNITSSTINDNTSNARGAGIFMGNGALTIRESTISGNTATLEGGGIYKSDGNLLMVGITVSANSASAGGGLNSVNGTTTISNSTFAYNTSPIAGSGIREENSPVRISSSIVAANVNNLSVPDTEGAFDSGGFNLIGNRGEADGLVHGVGGDQVGPVATPTITSMGGATPLDPRLAPLGHYGGAVPSHAFDNSSGLSPAIDKGMAFGATLDTRGYARTYDFPAIDNNGGDGTDIGAFEIQAPSAAPVRLQGRGISGARRGVGGALVTMIGMDGARRSVRTSSFGYFRFEGIQAADSFILEVRAKRYRFAPRAVNTTDGLGEMIIVAEP